MQIVIGLADIRCKGHHADGALCSRVWGPVGTTRFKLRQSVEREEFNCAERLVVYPVGNTTCAVCARTVPVEVTARVTAVREADSVCEAALNAKLRDADDRYLPCCAACADRAMLSALNGAYRFHRWGVRVYPACVGLNIPCDDPADFADIADLARARNCDSNESVGAFVWRFQERDRLARRVAAAAGGKSGGWHKLHTWVG